MEIRLINKKSVQINHGHLQISKMYRDNMVGFHLFWLPCQRFGGYVSSQGAQCKKYVQCSITGQRLFQEKVTALQMTANALATHWPY